MTSLNRQDADLHYEDGTHRTTPPTANGRQVTLWHTRITRHLEAHAREEAFAHEWQDRSIGPDDIYLRPGDVWTSVDGYQWRHDAEGNWQVRKA